VNETIVVWFSCGIASAVAAKRTIEKYGTKYNIRLVYNPVIEEHEDNLRFLHDVEKWLNVKVEFATNYKYPNCSAREIWDKKKFMSSPYGAPCTKILKKEARFQWEYSNKYSHMVLGFTVEEKRRHERFVMSERENVLPVLIEDGLTRQQCADIINKAGIKPSFMYRLGYPNANCIGCVKITAPQYWNHVRRTHPSIFNDRIEQSQCLGCKLVELGKQRIMLSDLHPDEKRGRPLKTISVDCGIFCTPEGL
jgi:hypothetical protein